MIPDIQIGKYKIGPNHPPFLIAEMSGNHNQSIERAFEIIKAAAASGAQALKLQTYTAETMTIDHKDKGFVIEDKNSLWSGRNLFELYKEAHTPWDWHEKIFQKCQELGMLAFSTPFDETAVDFLETLNVPCYKIASFENTCIPLLKKVAKTKKPVIVSTGMASKEELTESVNVLKSSGCKEIVLLKCTSTYPATPENTNIITIPNMREEFGVHVGLSDHTMGHGVAVASVALGARVIEKHFTLRRVDGGVDSSFSMEPSEFKQMANETLNAWMALGKVVYGTQSQQEEKSKAFRRSIYVVKDIKVGERFTEENVKCIRPGFGLPTKHYEEILGQSSNTNIGRGTPMSWDFVKK